MEAPPPTGHSLETALEEYMDRVKLRNEEAAKKLIDKLTEQIRRGY